jgi:hypothetical protein
MYYFVLGENDPEMQVIKTLLQQFGVPFIQQKLKT